MEKVIKIRKGKALLVNTGNIRANYYVYTLSSKHDGVVMYIGITKNPTSRLSRHLQEKTNFTKYTWLHQIINSDETIVMSIDSGFDNKLNALNKESELINKIKPKFNTIQTINNQKACSLLDLETNKVYKFKSQTEAAGYLGVPVGSLKGKIPKNRYIMSYKESYTDILNERATLKIEYPNGKIMYAVNQKHATKIVGCSDSAINNAIKGRLNTVKGCRIAKIQDDFTPLYITGKKVICLNDGKVFKTVKEAGNHYSVDATGISRVCKGNQNKVKGLKFEYV